MEKPRFRIYFNWYHGPLKHHVALVYGTDYFVAMNFSAVKIIARIKYE